MNIRGFLKTSLNEWEGRITSVVFLPRCNLRCRYCHAGDLVENPEELRAIPLDEITGYLREQEGWIDAVAVTGGEPTLHGDELGELLGTLQACGPDTILETNGTRPDALQTLLDEGLIDALSMDYKAPLEPDAYRNVTRREVDVDDIRRSLDFIMDRAPEYEFRITVVPGLVGPDELERMTPAVEGARKVALQNFKPHLSMDPSLRDVTPFEPEEMDEMQEMVAEEVERCVVRGRERGLAAAASDT